MTAFVQNTRASANKIVSLILKSYNTFSSSAFSSGLSKGSEIKPAGQEMDQMIKYGFLSEIQDGILNVRCMYA